MLCATKPISQKELFHDTSSTSHDRGHAGEELLTAYARLLRATVSLFARHFSKSPEVLGPEEIRSYQVYLTNRKEAGSQFHSSSPYPPCVVFTKVTLQWGWGLEDSSQRQEPQKLPMS